MDRIYEDTMSLLLECLSLIIKAGAGGGVKPKLRVG